MFPVYKSIYGIANAEYIIKKSRFIVTLAQVDTEEKGLAKIQSCKKQYYDARHNCFAYCIGSDRKYQRSSDDGEPSGTAGKPILEVLKQHQLTNTVAIVTRYFGGIKLGAAGLIRAYSHTVSLGIENATIATYAPFEIANITLTYPYIGIVEQYCIDNKITIRERIFTDKVTFSLQISINQVNILRKNLQNITAGTLTYDCQEIQYLPTLQAPPCR